MTKFFFPRDQSKEQGENPLGIEFLQRTDDEARQDDRGSTHPLVQGTADPHASETVHIKSPNFVKCQEIDHILIETDHGHPLLRAAALASKRNLSFEIGPDDIWLVLLQYRARQLASTAVNCSSTSSGVFVSNDNSPTAVPVDVEAHQQLLVKRRQLRGGWSRAPRRFQYLFDEDMQSAMFYMDEPVSKPFLRDGLDPGEWFTCTMPNEGVSVQYAALACTSIRDFVQYGDNTSSFSPIPRRKHLSPDSPIPPQIEVTEADLHDTAAYEDDPMRFQSSYASSINNSVSQEDLSEEDGRGQHIIDTASKQSLSPRCSLDSNNSTPEIIITDTSDDQSPARGERESFSDVSSIASICIFPKRDFAGPPSVELRGNVLDWMQLKRQAERIGVSGVQLRILDKFIDAQNNMLNPCLQFWNSMKIWIKYLIFGENHYHNASFLDYLDSTDDSSDDYEGDFIETEADHLNGTCSFKDLQGLGTTAVKNLFCYGINETEVRMEHVDPATNRKVSRPARLFSGHMAVHTSVKKNGKRHIRADLGWVLQYY